MHFSNTNFQIKFVKSYRIGNLPKGGYLFDNSI